MTTQFVPQSLITHPPETPRTPQEKEAAKTAVERGMDTSYTVNHTLSCYLFDVGGETYAWWRNKKEQEAHGHDHHSSPWQWFVGEFIGDATAIVPTLAVQRFFPGFMHGIGSLMEPIVKPILTRSTRGTANAWAQAHGLLPDSPEAKQRAEEIYRYEVDHLPQAVVWTTFGIPLAVTMHKYVARMEEPVEQIFRHQLAGKLMSSGALVGARTVLPGPMHRWDEWTSKHIYTPVTRIFGGGSPDAPQSERLEQPAPEQVRTA